MASDVRLDAGDGTWVAVEARVLKVEGSDVMIDSPARRSGGGSYRRALVHDQSDGLTINFNEDYPGGVHVNGAHLNLQSVPQVGTQLPAAGNVGDLVLMRRKSGPEGIAADSVSLWLCVPQTGPAILQGAAWREVQLGATVNGTA